MTAESGLFSARTTTIASWRLDAPRPCGIHQVYSESHANGTDSPLCFRPKRAGGLAVVHAAGLPPTSRRAHPARGSHAPTAHAQDVVTLRRSRCAARYHGDPFVGPRRIQTQLALRSTHPTWATSCHCHTSARYGPRAPADTRHCSRISMRPRAFSTMRASGARYRAGQHLLAHPIIDRRFDFCRSTFHHTMGIPLPCTNDVRGIGTHQPGI